MLHVPEETRARFDGYVQFATHDEGASYYVVRVVDWRVPDDLWKEALGEIKARLVRATETGHRFHFVFDVHECETLPLARIAKMQRVLHKRRAILRAHLHSSVILTNNRALEAVLHGALNLVSPTRPLRVVVAPRDPSAPRHATGVPMGAWEEARAFLAAHRLD